jgi:hypothetical protein
MRWIEVAPRGAATAIAITPPMEGGPTSVDSGIIISTDDIETDHATLKDAGVDVDAEIARMGARFRRCSGCAPERERADGRRAASGLVSKAPGHAEAGPGA